LRLPRGRAELLRTKQTGSFIYDQRHNDYGYTQGRVDFLIEKLKDTAGLDAVCKSDQATEAASQSTMNNFNFGLTLPRR
jgi:hypothetical protein